MTWHPFVVGYLLGQAQMVAIAWGYVIYRVKVMKH
jgi:hypothetical protein